MGGRTDGGLVFRFFLQLHIYVCTWFVLAFSFLFCSVVLIVVIDVVIVVVIVVDFVIVVVVIVVVAI